MSTFKIKDIAINDIVKYVTDDKKSIIYELEDEHYIVRTTPKDDYALILDYYGVSNVSKGDIVIKAVDTERVKQLKPKKIGNIRGTEYPEEYKVRFVPNAENILFVYGCIGYSCLDIDEQDMTNEDIDWCKDLLGIK